ncbi:MAG: T9SS type A sorting domain-containing protein [Bacteroidota bacterium]
MTDLYYLFENAQRRLFPLGLLLIASFVLPEAQAQILDTTEPGDTFGSAVATGDFNGDGVEDLAIGAPGEDTTAGGDDSGVVHVVFGAATGAGLSDRGNQLLIAPDAASGDRLGSVLAAGDFNGDGFDDLAASAPSADVMAAGGLRVNAGAVMVYRGSAQGLAFHQRVTQGLVAETPPNTDDAFGFALAVGDFDGDGRDDLAISTPFDPNSSGQGDFGSVSVFRGTSGEFGLGQYIFGGDVSASSGLLFGFALAAGDFDRDGSDDLAVGVPRASVDGQSQAGLVVLFDGDNDLAPFPGGAFDYSQNDLSSATPEAGDEFGRALTAGDFNGDGFDDLAIGVPFEAIESTPRAGAVGVLFGFGQGLQSGASFSQRTFDGQASVEDDFFGWSLAAGDFDGDGFDDLAMGTPGDRVEGSAGAGSVSVRYGSVDGLPSSRNVTFSQANVLGTVEAFDNFGTAAAAGDFNGDGRADLAIGVPLEDITTVTDAGSGVALYGTAGGLTGEGGTDLFQGNRIPVATNSGTRPSDTALALALAGPNPVRGQTALAVTLAEAGIAHVTVTDLLGREAAVLAGGPLAAGTTRLDLDASALPAGVYVARVVVGGRARTLRFTVVR